MQNMYFQLELHLMYHTMRISATNLSPVEVSNPTEVDNGTQGKFRWPDVKTQYSSSCIIFYQVSDKMMGNQI
jgi:hypothetical protein